VEGVLVQRLERDDVRGDHSRMLERRRVEAMADGAQQSRDEAGAEHHEDRDPVRGRSEEDGAEERERRDERDAGGELDRRHDDVVRPPVPGQSRDHHSGRVDAHDVGRADGDRSEPARKEQRRTVDGPHDQWLQQPALGVAAHGAQREEDREHDAEEKRREHRETEHRRPGEPAGVDAIGRTDVTEVAEEVVVGEPVEEEEARGQQQDDREDFSPQCLAQGVADDDRDRAHDVSPPTASRYVSSRVEVRTRTP
jgi:hypothetical protein